ncbi:MAG: hypothetical protein NUV67_03630 [archaeon]|nr:hypothetical protein [archaeon]
MAFGIIALILLSGCGQKQEGTGTLQGHISIGPICPVETNPPNPECEPTKETYAAYELSAYRVGSGDPGQLIKEATFTGDENGNYKIELKAGVYKIMLGDGLQYRKTIGITANETTIWDIDIDTGIR